MSIALTIPSNVVQNIARARSLLKRDETSRALEALIAGLNLYDGTKLSGKPRFEAEVLIQECVSDLNRQAPVRKFLRELTKSEKVGIAYTPREEEKLKSLLNILYKGLTESQVVDSKNKELEKEERKSALKAKGISLIKDGDMPKAKASLKRLAEEFGDEKGVLIDVADIMLEAEMFFEATELYEQSIELFPKESKAYAGSTKAYMELREFEKAESVYLKAIKTFGKHTRTLTNLAKVYMAWNKKDKAFEAASDAYKLDSSNEEAKEMVDSLS